jgi:hypothetical protein
MPIRLTSDQVNRYLIYKQGLAPGSQVRLGDTSIAALLRRFGALRASSPITPYLSLWARTAHFHRHMLDRALYRERSVLRVPAMHARLFLVPAEDYAAYWQATGGTAQSSMADLDDLLAEAAPHHARSLAEHEELARRVMEVLSAGRSLTVDELTAWLPSLNAHVYHDPEQPDLGYSRLGTRLIPAMCARGLLVRAQPQGGWRSTTYAYASLSAWAPQVSLKGLTRSEALRAVMADYVTAFGPVTAGDAAYWLGGLKRREVMVAFMGLGHRLAHVQIAGSPSDYYVNSDQVEALATTPEAPLGVALLPEGDSLLAAYSDLSRFAPPIYRTRILDRVGEPVGTVWWDGAIIGTWGVQLREERIRVRFFEAVAPAVLAAVGEKARDLARVLEFSLTLDMEVEHEQSADGPGDDGSTADPLVPLVGVEQLV